MTSSTQNVVAHPEPRTSVWYPSIRGATLFRARSFCAEIWSEWNWSDENDRASRTVVRDYAQLNKKVILVKATQAHKHQKAFTMKLLAIPILILSIALGFLYSQNPLLFGQRTGESHESYKILEHDAELDDELFSLASKIGADFSAYRNHCLRVLTFTKYFLPDEVLKEIPEALELASVALAYHDVALWTDKKLAYLDPSVDQMEKALEGGKYSKNQLAIMKDIILQHHKITSFESNRGKAADALVNAVRMADWADATMGIVRFGLPASLLEAAYDKIPEAGFHMILLGLGPRLSPGNLMGQLDILSIFKW